MDNADREFVIPTEEHKVKCDLVYQNEKCDSVNLDDKEDETLYVTKLQAFDLAFVDGFDNTIGVRYYENKLKESCIVYVMSNILVIFRLDTSNEISITNIVGHEMKIINFQINSNYKIMISWDIESIFIWDLQNAEQVDPVMLRIIHEPFGNSINVLTAGISYCGKYLLIASEKVHVSESSEEEEGEEGISSENYMLQFWEWSFGADNSDDSITLPPNHGELINIRFSCNENEEPFFALTFPRIVAFGTVKYDQNKIKIYYPKMNIVRKIIETSYLKDSRLVLSVAKKGDLIIWNDNTICENDIDDHENTKKCLYEKMFYEMLSLGTFDLTDIKNFNNYVVVTDAKGDTRFYDYRLLLLYIWKNNEDNPQPILSICPGPELSINDETIENDNYPRDITLQQNKFSVCEFFIVNSLGEVYLCDIQKDRSTKLAFSATYRVYSDTFHSKPWLVACLGNGMVQVVNYKTRMVLAQCDIFKNYDTQSPISYCELSSEENFIGITLRNGDIFMLDAFTCQPTHIHPIKFKHNALHMFFGPNNICAISDIKHAVNFIKYSNGEWTNIAKLRSNIDRIINVFFLNQNQIQYVVIISADRCYNKFIRVEDGFTIITTKRLEQAPKITAANIFNAKLLGIDIDGEIIVTANDSYKFALFNAYTADKLYTFLGPVFDSPIQYICHLPANQNDTDSYFIVVSKKTLGVILLPIDGNPYRNSGILAHHTGIYRLKISFEGTYVMVFGETDSGGYFWRLNRHAVKKNFRCGGEDLEPFCRLLPGGKCGWLFKEMQDYFLFFQIVSNVSDSSEKTQVTEYMKISELPDFMRSLGFFPSEFEIKDLIDEVTRTKYAWQQRPKEIGFSDLVKLYINHKPFDGYNIGDMIDSLKVVEATSARFIVLDTTEIKLTVQHLLDILTKKGEVIPQIQAMKYIIELYNPEGALSSKRCEAEVTDANIRDKFQDLSNISFTALEFCQKLLGLNAIEDPTTNSITLTTDERKDPTIIYPELENRVSRATEADTSSDDDNEKKNSKTNLDNIEKIRNSKTISKTIEDEKI